MSLSTVMMVDVRLDVKGEVTEPMEANIVSFTAYTWGFKKFFNSLHLSILKVSSDRNFIWRESECCKEQTAKWISITFKYNRAMKHCTREKKWIAENSMYWKHYSGLSIVTAKQPVDLSEYDEHWDNNDKIPDPRHRHQFPFVVIFSTFFPLLVLFLILLIVLSHAKFGFLYNSQ